MEWDVVTILGGTGISSGTSTGGSTTAISAITNVTYNTGTAVPTLTSGQTAPLQGDASGNLKVNIVAGGTGGGSVTLVSTSVTQPISGSITVANPTTPVVTLTSGSTVTIVPSGTQTVAATVVYNTGTTVPTLTAGQTVALQGDVSGNLKVNVANPTPIVTLASNPSVTIISGTVTVANPTPIVTLASNPSVTIVAANVTQPISGIVTLASNPSVTIVAANVTQPISGIVTLASNPSVTIVAANVTQPISGTITSVPSGTQIADVITPIGTVLRAVVSVTAAGGTTLVVPNATKSNRVLSFFAISAGQQSFFFASSTANLCGTAAAPLILASSGSGFELVDNRVGWFESGINNAITITCLTATTMGGCINYIAV